MAFPRDVWQDIRISASGYFYGVSGVDTSRELERHVLDKLANAEAVGRRAFIQVAAMICCYVPVAGSDVRAERVRQDAQWGGPAHDDTHSVSDWCGFIRKQLGMVGEERRLPFSAETLHGLVLQRFIKAAALAVAAAESMDRLAAQAKINTV